MRTVYHLDQPHLVQCHRKTTRRINRTRYQKAFYERQLFWPSIAPNIYIMLYTTRTGIRKKLSSRRFRLVVSVEPIRTNQNQSEPIRTQRATEQPEFLPSPRSAPQLCTNRKTTKHTDQQCLRSETTATLIFMYPLRCHRIRVWGRHDNSQK